MLKENQELKGLILITDTDNKVHSETIAYKHFEQYLAHLGGLSLSVLSSVKVGLPRMALSPILVPTNFPARVCTSPVASSLLRLSIIDRSAWSTRLDVYKNVHFNYS